MRFFLFLISILTMLSCSLVNKQVEENKLSSESHVLVEDKKELDLPGIAQTVQRQSEDLYKETNYTVISPKGINVHDKPSLRSNLVTNIPYLAQLKVVDAKSVIRDTLNKRIDHRGFAIQQYGANTIGDWLKVEYQGKQGYAFSAYLIEGSAKEKTKDFTNDQYGVTYPGRDCLFNYHLNPSVNWYGVYQEKNKYYLKPVAINYRMEYGNRNISQFVTYAKRNKGLIACFGSKEKKNTQQILLAASDVKISYRATDDPIPTAVHKRSIEQLKLIDLDIVKRSDNGFELIISRDDIKQKLDLKNIELEEAWPVAVRFVGDLDQDGHHDYIIEYKSEMLNGMSVLYLSSKATDGTLVKPVAKYVRGNCC